MHWRHTHSFETFGGTASTRNNQPVVDIPGGQLRFAKADKAQIAMMVRVLLPASFAASKDAADALAVAICHAQHRGARLMERQLAARA